MAIGRDIARSGAIPTVDTYSWSVAPGTSFTYQSWLSELIFFWVYRSGGMAAIVWLRNTLFALTLLTLAADAQRRSGSWRLAALAAAGVTTLAINNVTMRPQSFSWLPFALYWTSRKCARQKSLAAPAADGALGQSAWRVCPGIDPNAPHRARREFQDAN
jgi:hypothetical protein